MTYTIYHPFCPTCCNGPEREAGPANCPNCLIAQMHRPGPSAEAMRTSTWDWPCLPPLPPAGEGAPWR